MERRDLILIAGATGYIRGRLLWMLESKEYNLRCLARRPEYLRPRIGPGTQVVVPGWNILWNRMVAELGLLKTLFLTRSAWQGLLIGTPSILFIGSFLAAC